MHPSDDLTMCLKIKAVVAEGEKFRGPATMGIALELPPAYDSVVLKEEPPAHDSVVPEEEVVHQEDFDLEGGPENTDQLHVSDSQAVAVAESQDDSQRKGDVEENPTIDENRCHEVEEPLFIKMRKTE